MQRILYVVFSNRELKKKFVLLLKTSKVELNIEDRIIELNDVEKIRKWKKKYAGELAEKTGEKIRLIKLYGRVNVKDDFDKMEKRLKRLDEIFESVVEKY